MEELNLQHNTLDDGTMAYLPSWIHKVKRLDFSYCSISSNAMKQLFDALMMLNEPVRFILKITVNIVQYLLKKLLKPKVS